MTETQRWASVCRFHGDCFLGPQHTGAAEPASPSPRPASGVGVTPTVVSTRCAQRGVLVRGRLSEPRSGFPFAAQGPPAPLQVQHRPPQSGTPLVLKEDQQEYVFPPNSYLPSFPAPPVCSGLPAALPHSLRAGFTLGAGLTHKGLRGQRAERLFSPSSLEALCPAVLTSD